MEEEKKKKVSPIHPIYEPQILSLLISPTLKNPLMRL